MTSVISVWWKSKTRKEKKSDLIRFIIAFLGAELAIYIFHSISV